MSKGRPDAQDTLPYEGQLADAPVYPMRLQKFLARAGVASRRGSEDLMTAGRVSVNGEVVTLLGSKVDPATDIVLVDGVEVRLEDGPVTIALNKPANCVTTMSDPQGRPCVAQLVPVKQHPGLYPIGRLDRDTTGLLLFSTDGSLGNALLHPKHHVEKTYVAVCQGSLGKRALDQLEQGVLLDGRTTLPATAELIEQGGGIARVRLRIHEGRKRQVRRMLEAVGCPVVSLTRTAFGPIELDGLAQGSWRRIEGAQLAALYGAAGKQC